jgi:beta-lactamase regulating signal transducer with metallopeptidase domain
VIRHEQEHVARHDPAVTLLEAFIAAFWWFHPAVRVLLSRRRALREERCDDAVVARVPRDAYRRALLSAASLARPGRVPAVAATGPAAELRRRLLRIADPALPRRKRALTAALAVAAAAALLLPGVHPRVGPAFPVTRISR